MPRSYYQGSYEQFTVDSDLTVPKGRQLRKPRLAELADWWAVVALQHGSLKIWLCCYLAAWGPRLECADNVAALRHGSLADRRTASTGVT